MKKSILLTTLTLALVGSSASAGEIRLYDSTVDPGTSGFTFIKEGTLSGTTWGAVIIPTSPMGNPAGFRIWSEEGGSYSRADASVELDNALTGGIRISFKAYNQNYFWVASSLRKIALRGANPGVGGDAINSSSANYQNMLEIFTDGTIGGAWNWNSAVPRGTSGGGFSRFVTDPGGGVPTDELPADFSLSTHKFDFIINASATESFTYTLNGVSRTLNPLRFDLFVDDQLATPIVNVFGTIYENKLSFDPALGFGTFSLTTATSGHSETDFVIDEAYLFWDEQVSDGSAAPGNKGVILAASTETSGGASENPLLGEFWPNDTVDWMWGRGSWYYPVNAESRAYWLYHAGENAWLYVRADAPGFVYVYGDGWYEWADNGDLIAIGSADAGI